MNVDAEAMMAMTTVNGPCAMRLLKNESSAPAKNKHAVRGMPESI